MHSAGGQTGRWGGSVAQEQSAAGVTTIEAGRPPTLLSPAAPLTERVVRLVGPGQHADELEASPPRPLPSPAWVHCESVQHLGKAGQATIGWLILRAAGQGAEGVQAADKTLGDSA